MTYFCYSLCEEDYTWKNSLLWGNFIEHCKQTGEGSLNNRVVHVFIAALEFLPIISQIASIFEKLIVNHFVPPSGRNKKILEKALTSESIKSLYEEANATAIGSSGSGTWEIQFVGNRFHANSNAVCLYRERKVLLHKSVSDEKALSLFAFELINGIHADEFSALFQKSLLGQIDRENYVKEIERIEHKGTLLHHKTMEKAIQEMSWNKDLDKYKGQIEDFESYWDLIKDSPHADRYRKSWDALWIRRTILKISNCLKRLFT